MSNLTVVDLKEKLKGRNLPTTGQKAELMKRLLNAGVSPEELQMTEPVSNVDNEVQDDEPLPGTSIGNVASSTREIELLRRERDLAEREIELLRRELELARMTPPREVSTPNRVGGKGVRKWQDLKDLIGEFSGSELDYDRWERQAKALLASYDLDDHQAKALICNRLSGKALKWYHSRIDCVELSCDDLFRELRRMYGQRVDPLTLRRQLEARMWSAGETFADYLHDKVTLANRVPVTGGEAISYIIEGIPSQELRTQARVQCYQSTDEILKAFVNVPAPKGVSRQSAATAEKSRSQNKEQKPKETNSRRCYNCNEDGHIAAKCTKPERERGSCYKCGQLGHRAAQCNSTKDAANEGVHCVAHKRKESNDFQRKVELEIRTADGLVGVELDAQIDSGSPISFVKRCYVPRKYVSVDLDHDQFVGINGSGLRTIDYIKATIVFEHEKYAIMLRVVPDDTMQDSIILGRDFMKEAKLTIGSNREVIDIMNIDLESEGSMSAHDMRINDNLPFEIRQRARDLFEASYINAPKPQKPAVENIMTLTLTSDEPFYSKPRKLSYIEKGRLREILDELIAKNNIQHIKIATASPQANGQVERCSRTILPMIAKPTDERNTQWYDVLDDVEFACNNTISKATKESPSVLLFGVRQRGSVVDGLSDELEAGGHTEVSRDLIKTREKASERMQENQNANKRAYNRRHKDPGKYEIGHRVMIRNFDCTHGSSQKLIPRFKGPYQVSRVLRNDRYVLSDVEGHQLTNTPYHGTWEAANMRLWKPY